MTTTVLSNFVIVPKTTAEVAFTLVPPTTNSNGAFTYTSSNSDVATITNNVVIIVGVGSSSITASQASTASYTSATITSTLSVTQPIVNNLLVAVGSGGNGIATSTDGITWTGRGSNVFASSGRGVAYANGLWVAVGNYGNTIATSTNGTTWTGRGSTVFTDTAYGVAYGNGLWVAVGEGGNNVATSTDGLTWTGRGSIIANKNVAYGKNSSGNGLWIAIGGMGTINLATSTNGITWTPRNVMGTNAQGVCIAYGNGLWVAGGGSGSSKMASSTDGINWTNRGGDGNGGVISGAVTSIAYGNNLWVAFGVSSGGTPTYATSTDGMTWTHRGGSILQQVVYSVTYSNNLWIAGGGNSIATSTDGITWTNRGVNPITSSILGITAPLISTVLTNFSFPLKNIGDAAFSLTAPTTNSDGAFTYISSNTDVATIIGNVVTIVGMGTSTITACQEITNRFLPATITAIITVENVKPVLTNFVVPAKTFGNDVFSITPPTSNSDGAFTYTSSNTAVATVTGNVVSIIGAGTSTITASQATTADYGSAIITASFVVSRATTVLTNFSAITKTFGDASFSIVTPTTNSDGAFTYTSSNTAVATVAGSRITIIGGGTATITASQSITTNYTSGTTTATLTVNKATTVLSNFSAITKTFGNAAFSLVAPSSNSTGAFTYTSSNTAVATIAGSTVTIVGGGTATITASQATTTNYLAETTTSTMTVSQATPIITKFDVPAKAIGTAPFNIAPPTSNSSGAFTYTSSNTSVATIDGSMVTIVGLGNTTITAVQASTTNYLSETTTGILAIMVNVPLSIAVGQGGNSIATSTDLGLTWTGLGTTSFTTSGYGVAGPATYDVSTVTLGLYVAVGGGTNNILTSLDGNTWTQRSNTFFSSTINSIDFSNGLFVVGWDSGISTSTNGFSWTTRNTTPTKCVKYANNLWVAVGSSGGILTSTDGITWINRGTYMREGYGVAYGKDGLGNDLWIVGGWNNGNNSDDFNIATSSNGTTWTGSRLNHMSQYRCVAYANGIWVIGGYGTSNTIIASNNGSNWSGCGLTLSNHCSGIAYGNNLWVAVGYSGAYGGTTQATSTNGFGWVGQESPIWTDGDAGYFSGYFNNKWFVGGTRFTNGGTGIATSTNGSTWIRYEYNSGTNIKSITYAATVTFTKPTFIAVGQGSNTILCSNDGATWSSSPYGRPFTTAGYGVAWNGTQWVAVGSGTKTIAYSADGLQWTGNSTLSTQGNDVAYGKDSSGNGLWVVAGQGGHSLATSTNGITWTGRTGTTIFSTSGWCVAFGKDGSGNVLLVAVGQGGNTIATSTNGTTWTGRGATVFTTQGIGVTYANNRWVAVGSGGNSIATSTNGTTWTGLGTSVFTQGNGIRYTNNLWVATGQGGANTIATSVNGTTWVGRGSTVFTTAGHDVLGLRTAEPTIIFTIPLKNIGDSPFTIGPPTSNSTGLITYTSSDSAVATIDGSTMTIVGMGTSTITAVQESTDYFISGTTTATLTVENVKPVVTDFAVPEKTFGDAAFSIVAPTSNSDGIFTYTSSNTAVATIDGDTITIVGAGTSTITAYQAITADYGSAIITAAFTVNKATPTITNFSEITKTFGNAAFSLVAPTTNSNGAFTYTSSNTAVATIAGSTVTIVGGGTATITASQATTTNYLAETISASMTVSQATPTITNFSVPAKVLENAPFTIVNPTSNSSGAFTYTSSDTSVATIDGSMVTIVGKGTSTITVSQASTTNYLAGAITATFIVRLTPVITNFSAITKTFGDASFSIVAPTTDSDGAFTYTSSNTAVATVSGTTITIVSAGTSTITATQSLTGNYVSGTITTTLTVNKATPTITNFSAITKTFGNAAFSLVAPTSNSTGAFTYTSSNTAVATVSGTTVTIVGGGTATITASQATTANYLAGTITATITVSQATPTITNFSVPAKVLENAPFTIVNPTSNSSGAFTYTSSDTSVATIEGNVVTIVGKGTSTITASQASTTNYLSGSITATFIVRLTPVITNFSAITKTFGVLAFFIVAPTTDSDGTFTYTSSNTAVATVSGTTITIVGAGTSTITATQSLTANYVSGTTTSTLTVNKATPTITNFSAITKTFGNAAFGLAAPTSNSSGGFTYTSSDTAVATIAGSTVTIVGGGTATITASQATTTNYLAGTTTATLTVNKATAVLSNFSAITKTFGNAAFSITQPTTNSAGAFTYTSSNTAVATIAGSTVTIVGAGTATITASQATTTNHLAGTITATMTVSQAPPTITIFDVPAKAIGTAPFTLVNPISNSSGAFTYTSSNTSVATMDGSMVTIVGLGNTTITAVQASTTNYLSGSITGILAIMVNVPLSIAVGQGGNSIATSIDRGLTWTGRTGITVFTTSGSCVAFGKDGSGNNLLVAVGQGGNTIATSTNGTTWIGRGASVFTTQGIGVAYANNLWVAVGDGINSIATSTDGTVWTGRGKTALSGWGRSVAFNNGLWVAVGQGTNSIATSTDGVVWTGRTGTSIFSNQGIGVAFNNGIWVAVGDGTSNSIATSTDGTVWTGRGKTALSGWGRGVAYGNGLWVAVGQGTNSIATSTDGVVWTGRTGTSIFSNQGIGVAFNSGVWIAVGQGTNTVATSTDGVNWIGRGTSIFSTSGFGVAVGIITPPNVTGVSPSSGAIVGGTSVTITGTNFTGATSVTFDGLAATTINVVNSTTITCITPAHSAGAVGIIVTTEDGPSGEFSSFTYIAPPNITGISPLSGSTAGGTNATITGTSFIGVISITFDGLAATTINVVNSTTITCSTPARGVGAIGIIVTTLYGTSGEFSSFIYITPPNITSISKLTGSTAGETNLTITGTNFTGATSVTFDGLAATSLSVVNSTTITCITPAHDAGAVGIIVTTGGGPSGAFSSYTYITPASITDISPSSGSTLGGTSATITGTNFTGATSVTFGGLAATTINVVNSTTITCITRDRSAGAGAVGIIVTTGGGPSGAFSSFNYITPPVITSILPLTGSTAGGTSVTITGTSFTEATLVTFGGLSATSLNVVNNTTITCVTPTRSTGAVGIIVTSLYGKSGAFSSFTYIAPPVISRISPSSGGIAGGTSATITGKNFTGATLVTFGGIAATSISIVNSTTITCLTPTVDSAGAAGIIVTTGGGPSGAFSSFTYIPPPVISSISQLTGSTAGGTIATITGTNFTGATSVTFDGLAATSLSIVNSTTITCITPAHSEGAADIIVTTVGGSSGAFSSFTYITPPNITSISSSSGSTLGGTSATITGTNFTGATSVTFGGLSATSPSVVNSTTITCITPARTTAGDVGIIVTTGGGPSDTFSSFTYITPPNITGISPSTGSTEGLTSVTITGTNFTGATSVTFDGLAATTINVVNSNTITCSTPAHNAGDVDIIVTTEGGPSGAFSSYIYITPAVITSISPSYGSTHGGTSATITGTNFTGATSVTFDGTAATSLSIVNSTTITCITPAHATAGAAGIIITTGGGPSGAFSPYTYITPASITDISPSSGINTGGTSATITGTNFTGATSVTFGGVVATSLNVVDSTTITCITPAVDNDGAVGIIVTTEGGPSSAFSSFTYITNPNITGILPSSGSIAGGTSATITGINFTGATSVTFDGLAATNIDAVNSTTITCITPAHNAGAVDIIVTAEGGPSDAFSSFTYITPPNITGILSSSGSTLGGTNATITGTNFTGATSVTFDGLAATSLSVVDNTTITCITPAHNAGDVDIIVTTAGGPSDTFSSFTYITPPNITGILPSSGSTAGGTNATITGTSFTEATSVTFDGLAATTINVVDNTTITCITPAHNAGDVDIIVTTIYGTSDAFSQFTYITPPNITSISQLTGSTAGGTSVTITGTNFTGATSVTFDGLAATTINVVDSNTITCITPAHIAGAVGIIVTTDGGPSGEFSSFIYITPPNITSISKLTGSTAGETNLTITGTNFTGATLVTFGGLAATSLSVVNSTTITCITPAHDAGAVGVIVNTAGGPSGAFSSYTYITPPNITGILPSSGSTAGGTSVTITGTNFTGATLVTFDGLAATTINVVNSNTITCITPARSAGAVGIIVTTGGGPSSEFSSFTYNTPPNITGISSLTGSTTGGTSITITGTSFTGATSVTFGGVAATSLTLVDSTTITCITPARATAGAVGVIVTTGGGPSGAFSSFTYILPPNIKSMTPSSVSRVGGTIVTITGTNFIGATSVTLGGLNATSFNVVNGTSITCITPARTTGGMVSVIVTTGGGPSNAFSTFIYAPFVSAILPAFGTRTGGTGVKITGIGFTGATSVTFGGIAATNVSVFNPTTITCKTPAGIAAGEVGVIVSTGDGPSGAFSSFTYLTPPNITSISPSYGGTVGETIVIITGKCFTGVSSVLFGGIKVKSLRVIDDTTITCVTAARTTPGPVDITVQNSIGISNVFSSYTYIITPKLTSISPNFGSTTGGNTVTITGTDFTGATEVKVGDLSCSSFTVVSSTTITCITPARIAPGPVGIIVTTGGGPTKKSSPFTYILPPVITSISPLFGGTTGGNVVTITGVNFKGATSVTFGGLNATLVKAVNDTTITCKTPVSLTAGAVDVIVRTGGGPSGAFSSFTYITPPVISDISPPDGSILGGNIVTITGTNLTGATSVLFGKAVSTNITVVNDTTLTCRTPLNKAGASGVIVQTGGGPSGAFASFTFVTPASITGVLPLSGSTNGGTFVTIKGKDFTGATSVTIGGVEATSFTVVNATMITCITPARIGAGGVGIIVTTAGGQSKQFSFFNYITPPVITSLSPSTGSIAGGTIVTITGTNFTGATSVTIGGKAATPIVVVNNTTITCKAPVSTTAGPVDVIVTTGGGPSIAFSSFTYVTPAVITSISPTFGPKAGGTSVTITGTNFTGASNILFGLKSATNVNVVNNTTITCVTPDSTNPIAVGITLTTGGGLSNKFSSFTYR